MKLCDKSQVKELMKRYGFSTPDMTITEFVEDELTIILESWIDVKFQLPIPEEEVELFCQTQWGTYTCHGFYIPDNFSEEDSDYCWDFECISSYDEENDCYYIAPGWYERIHNWDDYGAVGINDKVTHWRPLSKPDFSNGQGETR